MGKIGVVIQREYNTRVRKKSFIITTLLMPLLMILLFAIPVLLAKMKAGDVREIIVVDKSGVVAKHMHDEDNITFMVSDRSYEELRDESPDVYGILVIGEDVVANPSNVQLYTYKPSTQDMESLMTRQIRAVVERERLESYEIDNLGQIIADIKANVSLQSFRIGEGVEKDKASSSSIAITLAYIFGFLMYMFVILYGNMVMQGVIEEKSSRVMEIIISSVKPFELMMGKIFGIALVAITQVLIWTLCLFLLGTAFLNYFAADMMGAAGQMQDMAAMGAMDIDPEMIAGIQMITDTSFLLSLIGGFLVFFIGGYLLYAAMFAAIGSAVDNVEDTSQLQLPVTVPIIIAMFILIAVMKDPNSQLAVWSSMIPFTSPVIMMARIPYGVPAWQIVTSLVILYTSFVAMVWFAAKIYRIGIFMYGKKPTLKEMLKWARYKS